MGFVGRLRGVLVSGVGVFFAFGVGFANFALVSTGNTSLFAFFAGSFSFFDAPVFGENMSHAFQLPFGISGSFLGIGGIVIEIIYGTGFPYIVLLHVLSDPTSLAFLLLSMQEGVRSVMALML